MEEVHHMDIVMIRLNPLQNKQAVYPRFKRDCETEEEVGSHRDLSKLLYMGVIPNGKFRVDWIMVEFFFFFVFLQVKWQHGSIPKMTFVMKPDAVVVFFST